MALVKCPDCGKMVSSRATACPECGCPSDYFLSIEKEESERINNNSSTTSSEIILKNENEIEERPPIYYRTSDFLTNVIRGYIRRQIYVKEHPAPKDDPRAKDELFKKYVQEELEQIGDINSYSFQSEELKKHAFAYYNALILQADNYDFELNNDSEKKNNWFSAFNTRKKEMAVFLNDFHAPVDNGYVQYVKEFYYVTFRFGGCSFRYHVDLKEYATLFGSFQQVIDKAIVELEEAYKEAGGIGNALSVIPPIANNYLVSIVQLIINTLHEYGVDYSADSFLRKYSRNPYNMDFDYDSRVEAVVEEFAEIRKLNSQLTAYRNAEKASRGRWQGGGFGLSGAIKGAVTASALNLGSDFLHSFGDSARKASDDKVVNAKLSALYRDQKTKSRLVYTVRFCIMDLFTAVSNELYELGYFKKNVRLDYETAQNTYFNSLNIKETGNNLLNSMGKSIYNYPGYKKAIEKMLPYIKEKEIDGFCDFLKFWNIEYLFPTYKQDRDEINKTENAKKELLETILFYKNIIETNAKESLRKVEEDEWLNDHLLFVNEKDAYRFEKAIKLYKYNKSVQIIDYSWDDDNMLNSLVIENRGLFCNGTRYSYSKIHIDGIQIEKRGVFKKTILTIPTDYTSKIVIGCKNDESALILQDFITDCVNILKVYYDDLLKKEQEEENEKKITVKVEKTNLGDDISVSLPSGYDERMYIRSLVVRIIMKIMYNAYKQYYKKESEKNEILYLQKYKAIQKNEIMEYDYNINGIREYDSFMSIVKREPRGEYILFCTPHFMISDRCFYFKNRDNNVQVFPYDYLTQVLVFIEKGGIDSQLEIIYNTNNVSASRSRQLPEIELDNYDRILCETIKFLDVILYLMSGTKSQYIDNLLIDDPLIKFGTMVLCKKCKKAIIPMMKKTFFSIKYVCPSCGSDLDGCYSTSLNGEKFAGFNYLKYVQDCNVYSGCSNIIQEELNDIRSNITGLKCDNPNDIYDIVINLLALLRKYDKGTNSVVDKVATIKDGVNLYKE